MESKLQHTIIEEMRDAGAWICKVQAANHNGIPDLLMCYQGHFIAIEVKGEHGRTSALQAHNVERIKDAGGCAYVCRGYDEWKELKRRIISKK